MLIYKEGKNKHFRCTKAVYVLYHNIFHFRPTLLIACLLISQNSTAIFIFKNLIYHNNLIDWTSQYLLRLDAIKNMMKLLYHDHSFRYYWHVQNIWMPKVAWVTSRAMAFTIPLQDLESMWKLERQENWLALELTTSLFHPAH